ncbi:AGAP007178-PA-like protein [Anopheles sinensis]|uniref:AGAP007178-PA-like protein n=1 Tax=Anopheles sinensis TaxID=74873 RepID=A0A084VBI5_ANOSI|nr:AGAP007178-PA-like protein [Anopheles sinensis]
MTSMMSASTADDTTQQSIPSFTSFSAELEPSWDYYEQQQQQQQRSSTERSSSAPHAITDVNSPQPTANGSYTRPWEMDTKDNRMAPPSGPPGTPGPPAPATPGSYPDHYPKLPSFQSQFHSFTDTTLVSGEPSLPQVTAVPVPISPSSASPWQPGAQVAAISSTANFKSPMHSTMSMDTDDGGIVGEKSTKKKRKRCGECVGCSRKDNCGDCAPCRNDKSHQICKTRRCEKLTEKKRIFRQTQFLTTAVIAPDEDVVRCGGGVGWLRFVLWFPFFAHDSIQLAENKRIAKASMIQEKE